MKYDRHGWSPISYKVKAFKHAYLVHYSILFHSRGGYFNSLVLQALELLPWREKTPGGSMFVVLFPVSTNVSYMLN